MTVTEARDRLNALIAAGLGDLEFCQEEDEGEYSGKVVPIGRISHAGTVHNAERDNNEIEYWLGDSDTLGLEYRRVVVVWPKYPGDDDESQDDLPTEDEEP